MKSLSATWRIRFAVVLACVATTAVTVVVCVDVVDLRRTAWAFVGGLLIGVYCGLEVTA